MCVIAESISVANVLPFEALKETADLTKQTPLIAVVTDYSHCHVCKICRAYDKFCVIRFKICDNAAAQLRYNLIYYKPVAPNLHTSVL